MATSLAAVVNVAPRLFTQSNGNTLVLTWSGPFILQSATNAAGPYTDVAGASSPYYFNILSNPQTYFRLRSPSFSLMATKLPGGQFQISGAGVPGCSFVMQASTNLTTWVNLQTNLSPFVFVDTNAWRYSRRFYRALLAH